LLKPQRFALFNPTMLMVVTTPAHPSMVIFIFMNARLVRGQQLPGDAEAGYF